MLSYNITYNTLDINNKKIEYRAWNTKDEKNYLIAIEDTKEEDITDDLIYDILIKPCLKNPDIVLTPDEQKYLMIEIRKKSLGSTFPMRYNCNKCGTLNDIEIRLDDVISFKEQSFKEIIIQDQDNDITLKVLFNEPKTNNLIKKIQEAKTNTEKNYIDFLIHIQEININNETHKDFSFEELDNFISTLPTYVFDELLNSFLNSKSKLSINNYESKCLICNEENIIKIEEIPNFLWV